MAFFEEEKRLEWRISGSISNENEYEKESGSEERGSRSDCAA